MLATLHDLAFIDEKFENFAYKKHYDEKNTKLHVQF